MHINATTHEHGANAKVYTYEADFDVDGDAITWNASVSRADTPLTTISGSIPVGSPALPALAEEAVRDEIIRRIDALDDKQR